MTSFVSALKATGTGAVMLTGAKMENKCMNKEITCTSPGNSRQNNIKSLFSYFEKDMNFHFQIMK